MGTAISAAIPAFASSTAKNKEIILVSDGAETCNSDPEGAARKAQSSGIKVGVIGFAVDTATSNQLKLIAAAGGGGYSFANNAEELYSNFSQRSENVKNWAEESKCLYKFLDDARACYKTDYEKMNSYMSQELLKLYRNEITQNEFDKIEEVQNNPTAAPLLISHHNLTLLTGRWPPFAPLRLPMPLPWLNKHQSKKLSNLTPAHIFQFSPEPRPLPDNSVFNQHKPRYNPQHNVWELLKY